MPSIKVNNQATAANALANLKFATLRGPAVIWFWASCVTATDTVSLSAGTDAEMLVDANPNVEAAADVVDIDRDQLLWAEPVGGGDLFLPVTATTAVNFLLRILEV